MLIPPSDPPPNVSVLGYFFPATFKDYWGCLVRCETDLVKCWVKLDKNNAKKGRLKLDKFKVRSLI